MRLAPPPYSKVDHDHDTFVDLEGALEIVVRSRKPKAVELVKWLTRKGVEKIAEEHQKAIAEEHQKAIDEKDLDQFPESEEIVVKDNRNSVHAFNRFEEEGHVERYGCHFKLIDLTREDLYDCLLYTSPSPRDRG